MASSWLGLNNRLLEGVLVNEVDDLLDLLVLVRRLRGQWAVAVGVAVHLRVGKQLHHMVGYNVLAHLVNGLAFESLLDTFIVVLLLAPHNECRHRYRLREELRELLLVPG